MEKYIIIKELPDASVGTEVIWDENANAFYYEKETWVSPHNKNYLSAGQVTQTPEYFCKANEFPEFYAYKYPVYSREEIRDLIKKCFTKFKNPTSEQFHLFDIELMKLGEINAKKIIQKQQRNNEILTNNNGSNLIIKELYEALKDLLQATDDEGWSCNGGDWKEQSKAREILAKTSADYL